MVKVWRGTEKIPFKEQVKWPDRGRYFFDNPKDARWYAQRAKTLSGKISSLDLTKEQFDKAKKLSRSRTTRLGGEVIVESDLLKKQKTDILRTIMARAGNLSKLALRGLSVVASLPAQVVVMTLTPTDANADEVNMTLEDFATLAEEAKPKKEMMAAGGNVPSTDIKDYYRRAWGIGDRKKQKPRLGYMAFPLVVNPTTIGLVATTLGIAGEAARRYINENPGLVQAAEQGVDKIKEFVSFKEKKEEPSKEVVEVKQEDWSGSFKDQEPKLPKEEPPKDPIPEVVEDLAIQELIENYRKSKTREGSTQPIMKDYEKIDMITSVIETFKNKYKRLPAYTELKNFFPKLGSKEITRLVDEGEIELLPEYLFREINKQKLLDTKASDEYRTKMRNYAKERAIIENRLAVSEKGPFEDNPEVFFPKTITYNGKTYNAKEFFMNNLIEKAKHGTWRKTGKTTLKNAELAKIFNTNERMVEKAIRVIRASPDWNVTEPGLVDRSIYENISIERIKNANKKLSPLERDNVKIQDNWVYDANQDIGNRSLKSVKKNKPQLIKELQWKLEDGEIVQKPRSDEKLAEDLKKFFSVNHNVKKSTEQFNIQTLVNRGLTTSKINTLLNSIEAYIKNNPTHIRKIQSMEKFLRKRGLRVRIDGVSEELLDKLGKKNNFFGADPSPKGMFNSGTGQSVQWEKYLKFLDLALEGPEGVPLIKMAQGGPVLFSLGGLSGVDQYIINRGI